MCGSSTPFTRCSGIESGAAGRPALVTGDQLKVGDHRRQQQIMQLLGLDHLRRQPAEEADRLGELPATQRRDDADQLRGGHQALPAQEVARVAAGMREAVLRCCLTAAHSDRMTLK